MTDVNKNLIKNIPSNPLIIAITGSAYGVHGWIRVFPFTENPISIFDYQPWFIKQTHQWRILILEKWQYHHKNIIMKVEGINDRNTATEQLNYCQLMIEANKLPKLKEGEYYWKDLIGCQVINLSNNILGKVNSIMETGSNDVLVIKINEKKKQKPTERLIPFLYQKVIKEINLPNRTIYVDWGIEF
ncbi:Ribosome maturation factor RimM [Candidatus Erwinia haradaeae]|uniref:Ribosome maturation factor RimM n=1 Tax=Candidatus Erwinia haradaeae TaxID=1922217 RepID=A0A451CYT9_9GAMM|nr:ribosome maturation factor RimM [Candidatus Erwinia haradaeae]VFP78340.1 Ribosome maturation factor RimM [Candidatus Erwinia haradaeae]